GDQRTWLLEKWVAPIALSLAGSLSDGYRVEDPASVSVFFQNANLLLKQPEHTVLGDENVRDAHLELLCYLGPWAILDRRTMKGHPGGWLHALLNAAHCDLKDLAVECVLESLFKVGQRVVRIGDRSD